MLQNLRLAMHRQIRRHSTRRSTSSTSRRRLRHLWSRLFHSVGRARGNAPLLDPPGPTQVTLGLHSYRTVGEQDAQAGARDRHVDEVDAVGRPRYCCSANTDLQPCTPESPASPLSSQSVDSPEEGELSPVSREGCRPPHSEPPTPGQSDSAHSEHPATPQEACVHPCHPKASKKLVLELAVNLKGVSLRRYSPLGPLSPVSPPAFSSSTQTPTTQPHPQGPDSPTEPLSSSVKADDTDNQFTVEVPSRERRSRDESREGKSRLCRFSGTLSDEGGDSGRETTPC